MSNYASIRTTRGTRGQVAAHLTTDHHDLIGKQDSQFLIYCDLRQAQTCENYSVMVIDGGYRKDLMNESLYLVNNRSWQPEIGPN